MKTIKIISLLVFILGSLSCSSESLKRTGYETLKNIDRLQCEKELSSECTKQESYEDYQRKRKEIEDF